MKGVGGQWLRLQPQEVRQKPEHQRPNQEPISTVARTELCAVNTQLQLEVWGEDVLLHGLGDSDNSVIDEDTEIDEEEEWR